MPTKLAVLITHGMGTQTPDFWQPLANALVRRLDQLGIPSGAVELCGAYWADILIDHEADVWQRAQDGGPLAFKSVRRFVVNALGDAVAYRRMDPDDNS